MLRTVAMTVLAMSITHTLAAPAGGGSEQSGSTAETAVPVTKSAPTPAPGMVSETSQATKPMSEPSDAKLAPSTPEQTAAAELARQKLAEKLQLAPADIKLTQIQARTWSDSNMGCGKPGSMALQVITEGYAVTLLAQGAKYRVHVSGNNTVVCDQPMLERNQARRPSNARGLDVMIEKARQDLAQKLGVDPAQVHLYGTKPQRWSDTGLDCPLEGEKVVSKPVNGYRLALKYQARIYVYHCDMQDVRACPPIQAQ